MHIYEVRPRRDKRGFDIVIQNKIESSETELPKSGSGKILKRLPSSMCPLNGLVPR